MKSTLKTLFGLVSEKEADSPTTVENREEIKHIPIANIIPNRYQPRTVFNEDKIDELALTIRTHGVIQPIAVRAYDVDRYEIIAGERRFRAVSKLGWDTIPALVKDMSDAETASVALIENLQREELTAIEEAIAYQKLLDLHSLTQEALAQRLGKGQSTVANKLRLLRLPSEVRQALLDRQVTERHARALIPLKDAALQVQVLQEIIEQQLNVKQTEEAVERILYVGDTQPEEPAAKPKGKPKRKAVSKDMRIAMNTIRQSLQMVADSGLNVASEEEEFDEYYQITIKIPKKK